jgi:ABC-type amino acid transport substrate-binding protein
VSWPSRLFFALTIVVLVVPEGCNKAPPETCRGQTVRLVREDILTVGTDFANPPFAFDHPETGKPTGFEVELSQAIADQLGLKLLLVNRTSAALIPGLLAHRHDLAASALVDSSDLRRIVCVSRSYLDADLGLLARAGEPPSVKGVGDLAGRSFGVVKGSRAEQWAKENVPPTARVMGAETSEDLITALRAGRIDGVVDDLSFVRYMQVTLRDVVVVETIDTGKSYAFATSPDNKGLVDAVNEALRRLRTKGKLKALRGKWFGE